ncbi:MAG TPA: glycosyltransferase family 4 protein [Vicinamibacterales bacterium]|nr:glycosyltransferase family 4 protein [Vicinamibacterales bacterium]
MRLLYLTAGAAEMYCGSCLRDNALAAALKARGHDVLLAPIYTPTTTDEANVSDAHVFFGGVSVFLEQHVPLFRHTPAMLDRLWDNSTVLKLASKRQIKVDPTVLGSMTVSMLQGLAGHQRKEIVKMLRWLEGLPPFDVINLPFTLLISLARPLKDALGVPVACTLQGEDLFLDNLREPWRSQSMDLIGRHLDDVDVFIAVSDYYREFMSGYFGLAPDRVRTVRLGITLDGHEAQPARTSPPYTIGFFARIAPEKGLHVLVEAYRRLRARPAVPDTRLLAAGYLLDEHRGYLSDIERQMAGDGLSGHFTYAGAPDRAGKIALLHQMDIVSVPSTYAEPKGLSVLEAMANGIPVVQPRHGAFPEVIERTGGGLLVPPGDPDALAAALFGLLTDRDRAAVLGRAGAAGVRAHYSGAHMAESAERVYASLVG